MTNRNSDKDTIWRRWLDPSNVIAIARGLGVLFLLALGGYVWLWKLEWRIDTVNEKLISLISVVTAHNAGAEDWKRRILLMEDDIQSVEEDQTKHIDKSAHDKQAQETARMRIQINALIRQVEKLQDQQKAMTGSGSYAVQQSDK